MVDSELRKAAAVEESDGETNHKKHRLPFSNTFFFFRSAVVVVFVDVRSNARHSGRHVRDAKRLHGESVQEGSSREEVSLHHDEILQCS